MKSSIFKFSVVTSLTEDFTTTEFLSCTLLVMSSFTWGFDNQGFATIQAMDSFLETFGEYNSQAGSYIIPTKFLSYLNSFQYLGFVVGLIIGSYVSSIYGRKWSIRVMSVYALITAAITISSKTKEQILTARVLNYVFVGMEASTIPILQSEITPSRARGFMVGAFQLALGLGGLIVHIITNATAQRQDNSAWRIPVGLFFVFPFIVGVLVNFIPESPRWLLLQGRDEEAFAALTRFRKGKSTNDEIEKQFAEMKDRVVNSENITTTYKDLFIGTNLKRTLICVFVNIFQQVTGQAFASQYGTIYIKSLGTVNPFKMTIGTSVVSIGFVVICLFLADKVGRKVLVISGTIIQIAGLITMGALGVQTPVPTSAKNGIVGCMFLFTAGFSLGWAPLTYVVITEVPSIKLRDKTQRFCFFFNILFAFLVAFTLPYLLNDDYAGLQSKVGFIYGSFAILSLIFVILFVPECKGRSLEEIDYMFEHKVPIRKFQTYNTFEVSSDKSSTVNEEKVSLANSLKVSSA